MDAMFTGQQIAARRKALGLTQKALAEQLHVTDKAVSKWERGINFPDLGLMESLAQVLDTTPAVLLGLEDAGRDEIVSSITHISSSQLEQSHRDIRQAGWISIGAAVLLILSYLLFGKDVLKNQIAYQILSGVILLFVCYGGYVLIKYGEVKKWDTLDWLTCYGFAFSLLTYWGIQFFTGRDPHQGLGLFLIAAASSCIQLLFYRIMVPRLVKAVPLLLSAGFALWHGIRGFLTLQFLLPSICCAGVWLLCRRRDSAAPLSIKKTVLVVIICLLVLCILLPQPMTMAYVELFQEGMEEYCQALLDGSRENSGRYGLWKVSVYPEQNMVQFTTGGSGLVPSSSYEGFYYAAGDVHLPFQGADVPLDIQGNSAWWDDGTDNHGSSYRFLNNWFWFEAHF